MWRIKLHFLHKLFTFCQKPSQGRSSACSSSSLGSLDLTAIHRHNRVDWANAHIRWRLALWRGVIFTDEFHWLPWFALISLYRADYRQRVWRRVGERFADVNVVKIAKTLKLSCSTVAKTIYSVLTGQVPLRTGLAMVDQRSWAHVLSVKSRGCVWEIDVWVLPALLQRLKGWGVSLSVLRP